MKRLITAIVLSASLFPAIAFADITCKPRIIDGDTIEISGERIRIYGIDAPEAKQSCLDQRGEWWCGFEATNALAFFIGKSWVTCVERDVDRYGRLVGVCYVGGVDGLDVGEHMVREGWALSYRQYSIDYIHAEEDAKSNRRGLWRGEFVEPWGWRRGKRLNAATRALKPSTVVPEMSEPTGTSCCKVCRKGKACGNSCIARSKTCHRPAGCACDG